MDFDFVSLLAELPSLKIDGNPLRMKLQGINAAVSASIRRYALAHWPPAPQQETSPFHDDF
jgi:hypothetical protein